ncbi:class I adenylate-forming enzyme family protein [Acinetobacter baumannii]|uniref:class I adenylate-forming enzyme family protein n=1 Tax=Acinetobacter baumannii TaxID=470 RepID=UPI00244C1F45|nr:class I adenylate-forming enzyme family protein [Acinetobacter baumannii]MDH2566683.1 class I adenylate-forming enzyme family protein [Acinetobacter baumannii]
MISNAQLDLLLQDENLGAGNFIYKIYEKFKSDEHILSLIENENTKPIELSIKDIILISDRLASAYLHIGVKPKEVVALFFKDSFDYFLHFVALNSLGAIPCLINGKLSHDVLHQFLKIIRPQYLMLNIKYREEIESIFLQSDINPKILGIEDFNQFISNTRTPIFQHQPQDVIMIGHTSGTTGVPKGVIFTHESMFHGVRSQIKRQKGSNILSILPHSHGASISLLMLSLTRGAKVSILSQRDPKTITNIIKKISPNVVIAFPQVYVDLCREDLQKNDFESISYWISTGDANHESHIKKLIQLGHNIDQDNQKVIGSFFIDNLGSSEFAFAIFRNVHGLNTNQYNRCIGKPFPWVNVSVFDENGKVLSHNQIGRLGVKSKSVTLGYWNNHSLTEINKINGYWLTGDLVYFDEHQNFYHVDRTSDSMKIDGTEVYSCQIEEFIITKISQIFDLSIVKSTHNELIAYVELTKKSDISVENLLREINHLMQENQWPLIKNLTLQSANEYTGVTGKKLKRELRNIVH